MSKLNHNACPDSIPLTFGKYKGMTPDDISEEDPAYIVWLYENFEKPDTIMTRTLYLACVDYKTEL